MHHQAIRHTLTIFALVLPLMAQRAFAGDSGALPPAAANAMAQDVSPQAIAEYRRKLREYQQARSAFEAEAGAYWSAITEKRRGRNAKRREHQSITLDDYVLTQPPVYTGPKRPVNPLPEPERTAPRAQIYSGGRRSPQGCRRQLPVDAAAARKRPGFQARLRPLRIGCGTDARAGGAGLCIRDRRQRHACVAIGLPRLARDLDRDRLQPAAHHQHASNCSPSRATGSSSS